MANTTKPATRAPQPEGNNTPAKKQTFFEKAIESLESLTVLEINTVVGNFTFLDKGEDLKVDLDNPDIEKMISRINLLSGDITTAMTDKFVGEYQSLQAYHMKREEQGHNIIVENIKVVKEVSKTIIQLVKDHTENNKEENKLKETTSGNTTEG